MSLANSHFEISDSHFGPSFAISMKKGMKLRTARAMARIGTRMEKTARLD
jgi:hypothetical protein